MEPNRIIAVIGAGSETDPAILEAARRVGALLAGQQCILITGGGAGVMAAASAGARELGGTVVGILPGESPLGANIHVDVPIATGLGEARNAVIATAASALIAVGGEHGTLSEIALGLKQGRIVVALDSRWATVPGVRRASTPEEAVALALGP